MRPCLLLLACLLVAAPGYPAAETPPRDGSTVLSAGRLAVLEFTGEGFDTSYLGAVTDRVRGAIVELVNRRGLTVMTQENMEVMLGQAGKGTHCLEGECEVETARRLGAAYVITGRLARIEKTYSATVKLHDTRTGVLLSAVTLDDESLRDLNVAVADKAREVIQIGIPGPGRRTGLAALPLLGGALAAGSASLPPGGTEEVVVDFTSQPGGALVRVDGLTACQRTPCRARATVGPHEVEMELFDYEVRSTVFEARRGGKLVMELSPRFGIVNIRTEPPGVLVAVNGEEQGRGPVEGIHVAPGPFVVSVVDRCFAPDRVMGQASKGRVTDIDVSARAREARLRVLARDSSGRPIDGTVKVDEVSQGKTGVDLAVPLCSTRVSMAVDGETWSDSLRLTEGELNKVEATLVRPRPPVAESRPRSKPPWTDWMGATGILAWGGAGAAAIYFHNTANGYAPGDPRRSEAITTGQALMIASNVGAVLFLTAVIGRLVTD